MTLSPSNPRAKPRWLALIVSVALLSTFVGSSAMAVHAEGLFELDVSTSPTVCAPLLAPCGDANVADAAAAGDDWATIYAGGGSAFASTFLHDPVSSAENSYYTGGGSKDVRDIPLWQYGTTNDPVPDKDDIADAFAAAYTDIRDGPDHTIIYFGMDRYDNNGDAESGFWFFQDVVSLDGSGGFTGVHTLGDVLVLVNWGGSNPLGAVTVYQWVGGKNPLQLVSDNTTADCAVASATDNVCAVVNRQAVDPPWEFQDKSGSTDIRPLELFEAGIDLTALFGVDRCFASFLSATRSSHSPTAQLKDFTLDTFEQCGAAISISPDAVNEVGDTHTFTVNVTKSVGGSTVPAAGVFPVVTLTAANGAVVTDLVDNCATIGTDSNGDCTVTFTSNSAGTVTGHAEADFTIGTESFHVETDGLASNSGDAVKRFVDAQIDLSPLTDTNEVNDAHTITATVQQDDGLATGGDGVDGWGPAPAGTLVTFSLLNNTAGATFVGGVNTCTTIGVTGSCSVDINTSSAGDVDIHATTTFTLDTVSLTRVTDGIGNNSADANKVYVDAQIDLSPLTDTNEVNDDHEITATVQQDDGLATGGDGVDGWGPAPAGTLVTFSLLNNTAGATFVGGVNTCTTIGVTGSCSVFINTSTAGDVDIHATTTFDVSTVTLTRATDGSGNNSADANKVYVDAWITINPPLDTNTVGDPHTFTVEVKQASGTVDTEGDPVFVAVPDGTLVTVTLTPTAGATISVSSDTCATTGTVGGICTVTFTSSTSGTVTGHAWVSLLIDGVTVIRETDGIAPNSGNAVKHFVAGSIAWTKVDNAGELQGGATFELCKTHSYTLPSGPFVLLDPAPACLVILDNGPIDEDPDDGEFLISGLSLGRYTVTETIAPEGFIPDPDTVIVELTPGDTEITITEAFVNDREVLKITGFGYTNEATGEPTSGVVSGTVVYTVNLHNYGTAAANLTNSTLVVTGPATCTASNVPGYVSGNTATLSGIIVLAGADAGPYTLTCTYTDAADLAVITATLIVKSTTNGLEREASGSPATITFTVQAD